MDYLQRVKENFDRLAQIRAFHVDDPPGPSMVDRVDPAFWDALGVRAFGGDHRPMTARSRAGRAGGGVSGCP